jgi:glycosyltransferase involved in cell wall biosynthesis
LHLAFTFGGAEQTTRNLLEYLDRRKVHHITLAAPESLRQQLPERYDAFIDTDHYELFGGFESHHALLSSAKKVGAILSESGADIALGMMHYPAALVTLGAHSAKVRIRTVASFRGPFYEYMRHHEKDWRRRFFLRNAITITTLLADRIIVPSQGTQQELRRRFLGRKRKTIVIPNGIDTSAAQQAAKEPIADLVSPNNQTSLLCAVARLAPEKNLQLLLAAFRLVVEMRPSVHLIILGEGPERSALEAAVSDWQLKEKVSFIGFRDNVYPYLAQAELFIHTCLFEGFGYTLLEAMACGTPVIATDCPYGPREIIGNNCYGLLVPLNNSQVLANTIFQLLNSKTALKTFSQRGLVRARELSIERMIGNYESVFEELANS